jgi:hypothetical protein
MHTAADRCKCKFVAIGEPMDARECTVHTQTKYACVWTDCENYRPAKERTDIRWPRCVCGEIAQEHN